MNLKNYSCHILPVFKGAGYYSRDMTIFDKRKGNSSMPNLCFDVLEITIHFLFNERITVIVTIENQENDCG